MLQACQCAICDKTSKHLILTASARTCAVQNANFMILGAAITKAGLDGALSGAGPFTAFVSSFFHMCMNSMSMSDFDQSLNPHQFQCV